MSKSGVVTVDKRQGNVYALRHTIRLHNEHLVYWGEPLVLLAVIRDLFVLETRDGCLISGINPQDVVLVREYPAGWFHARNPWGHVRRRMGKYV